MGHTDPTMIGKRYILHEKLGAGGMGAVYRATDRLTGKIVALKQVYVDATDLLFKSNHTHSDSRLSLAHEFRMLASLHHPNIINVLDYGFVNDEQPFFTMALLDNPLDIVTAAENLTDVERCMILVQLLQALAYLHQRGLVHRDLKPANVLYCDGIVKVVDFGLAMETSGDRATSGTLAYMAPEVLQHSLITHSADLYAVGVLAFQIFSGKYPYGTRAMTELIGAILHGQPDWSLLPDCLGLGDGVAESIEKRAAADLKQVIHTLMARTPDSRYRDAYDVIRDLCKAVQQPVPQESPAIRESYLQAARFVGRETELTRLTNALEQALNGSGSAWLVGGESGVGKSRLVEELRIRALVKNVLAVRGESVATGGQAYGLWREPLRRLILATALDDLEIAVLKEIVPDIEKLVGKPVANAPLLTDAAHQKRIIMTIANILRRQEQPVVLILEDLHWSNESLEPLKYLLAHVEEMPLLIVGNFRDEERPELPDELPNINRIKLHRLSNKEIAELSETMLGRSGTQPEVLDLLERETEGNVFFLVEVVRALAEDAGRLASIGSITLPGHVFAGGMRQVVQRRLTRVPERARFLLNLAAVAGRYIDRQLLEALIADSPENTMKMDDWLTICANVAILESVDGRWRFAHDKLRDGVLEDLEPDQRRALHRQIALMIERMYPNDPQQAVALADHWNRAGDRTKEMIYAHHAGELSMMVSSLHQAQHYFNRALALLPADDTEERITLLNQMGHLYRLLGDYATSRSYYEQALTASRNADNYIENARALNGLGVVLRYLGHIDDALTSLKEALQLAKETGDLHNHALALNGLGTVETSRGNFQQAEYYHDITRNLLRDSGLSADYADAIHNLGVVHFRKGQYDLSLAYYAESRKIREVMGDRLALAREMHNIGAVYEARGEVDQAMTHYQIAYDLNRELHDRMGMAYNLNSMGVYANRRGDFHQAQQYYEQALNLFVESGYRSAEATMLGNLGNVALLLGDYDRAEERHKSGLAIKESVEDRWGMAYSYNNLGRVLYRRGDYAQAKSYFEKSITLKRETGDRLGLAYSLCDLGFVYMQFKELHEAARLWRESLNIVWEINSMNVVMDIIAGFAWLNWRQNKATRSAEYLSFVVDHPALHSYGRITHIDPLRIKLTGILHRHDFDKAMASGKTLDMNALVKTLLDGGS